MKSTLRNILLSGIVCLSITATHAVYAQDSKTATPANPEAGSKAKSYGFHGIVGSVNNSAKSIGLKKVEGERVIKIDSGSTLFVDQKPAMLSDVKTGYYAHGSIHKENGEEYIVKATFEKEAPTPKDKKKVEATTATASAPAAVAAPAATNGVPAVASGSSTNAASDASTPPAPKKKKKKKDSSTNSVPMPN